MNLALELCWKSDALLLLSAESLRHSVILQTIDFISVDEPLPDRMVSLVTRDRHTLTWAAERLHSRLLAGLQGRHGHLGKLPAAN